MGDGLVYFQLVCERGFYAEVKVSVGETVSQGQQIGTVGTTGYSFGNHLHFEVRVKGESVQPLDYVTPS